MSNESVPPVTAATAPLENPPTDKELLNAHIEGDSSAFGTLIARHRARLWAVALRTTGDPDEAADALQDALVSAFRRANQFRGESAVTTWLHRIVVNASLDRLRRRSIRSSVPLPDDDALGKAAATATPVGRGGVPRDPAATRKVEGGPGVAESDNEQGLALGPLRARIQRGGPSSLEVVHGPVALFLDPLGEPGGVGWGAEGSDPHQVEADLSRLLEDELPLTLGRYLGRTRGHLRGARETAPRGLERIKVRMRGRMRSKKCPGAGPSPLRKPLRLICLSLGPARSVCEKAHRT